MTTEEKLLKLKKLADAMYYAAQHLTTDASRLHKAMDEYHKFIIREYKEEPEYLEEETKYCAFSTSRYTDEDRKALCKGCDEECKFNQKDEIKSVHAQHTTISSSLNDYLCKAYSALYKGNGGRLSFARLQNMAIDITEWQKEQMMAKAVEGGCFSYKNGFVHISCDIDEHITNIKFGDKIKVIVIKEG